MAKLSNQKVLNAIENSGGILTTIAKKCDVTRKALYEYLERNPTLRPHIEQEKEKILDLAEVSLFAQVKNKEAWATKYLLSTLGKTRGYAEKHEHEVSGGSEPIRIDHENILWKMLTPAQQKRFAEKMRGQKINEQIE